MTRANFSTCRARIQTHTTDSEALTPGKALADGNPQLTRRADVLKKVGSMRSEELNGRSLGLCGFRGNKLRESKL